MPKPCLTISSTLPGALALIIAATSAPAIAQDDTVGTNYPAAEKSVFERDNFSIGVGGVALPDYEGSDDYRVTPFPIIRGRVGGVDINPRQAGIALDFLTAKRGAKLDFMAGPMVSLKLDRSRKIDDPVVRATGKLDTAIETGATVGLKVNRVLHKFDSISFSADVKWDVSGAYKGMVWRPQVTYLTPLSKGMIVALQASARHVDDNYAEYYYSVTPEQNLASGLPKFSAKGGWDKVNFGAIVTYDLSGNALDGGWAVFGIANYAKMLGDGKDTPFTSIRGDDTQLLGGVGIGYTF